MMMTKTCLRRTFAISLLTATLALLGARSAQARDAGSFSVYTDLISVASTYSSPLIGVDFKLGKSLSFGPQVLIAGSGLDSSVTGIALGYGARANIWLGGEAIGGGGVLSIPVLYAPVGDFDIVGVSALLGYNFKLGPLFVRPALGAGYASITYNGNDPLGNALGDLDGFGLALEAIVGLAF